MTRNAKPEMTRIRFDNMPPLRAGNVPLFPGITSESRASKRRFISIRCSRLLAVAAALLFANFVGAQDSSSAIDQSRLYPRTIPPTSAEASPQNLSGPQVDVVTSDDESFGAQQILKEEEKVPEFL